MQLASKVILTLVCTISGEPANCLESAISVVDSHVVRSANPTIQSAFVMNNQIREANQVKINTTSIISLYDTTKVFITIAFEIVMDRAIYTMEAVDAAIT